MRLPRVGPVLALGCVGSNMLFGFVRDTGAGVGFVGHRVRGQSQKCKTYPKFAGQGLDHLVRESQSAVGAGSEQGGIWAGR